MSVSVVQTNRAVWATSLTCTESQSTPCRSSQER